jgi:hypothetical protein
VRAGGLLLSAIQIITSSYSRLLPVSGGHLQTEENHAIVPSNPLDIFQFSEYLRHIKIKINFCHISKNSLLNGKCVCDIKYGTNSGSFFFFPPL